MHWPPRIAGASCYCPITTTLQVSAVMEALAGSVNVLAVVVGLYVPQLPPLSSNTGVVANAATSTAFQQYRSRGECRRIAVRLGRAGVRVAVQIPRCEFHAANYGLYTRRRARCATL